MRLIKRRSQVDDVLEIMRKMRHSSSAARVAESSHYAAIRLLLKHRPEAIVEMAGDPVRMDTVEPEA